MKNMLAGFVLATIAASAAAVPMTITTTSTGVTTFIIRNAPDIPIGSAFKLVMQASFDTDALSVETVTSPSPYRYETVAGPASFSFTIADRQFAYRDDTSTNSIGASFAVDDYSGRPFLNLAIRFHDEEGYESITVQNGMMLDVPGYSPAHLLDQPQELVFGTQSGPSAGVLFTGRSGFNGAYYQMNAISTAISVSAVPEPSGYAMLGLGLALVASVSTRRFRAGRHPSAS